MLKIEASRGGSRCGGWEWADRVGKDHCWFDGGEDTGWRQTAETRQESFFTECEVWEARKSDGIWISAIGHRLSGSEACTHSLRNSLQTISEFGEALDGCFLFSVFPPQRIDSKNSSGNSGPMWTEAWYKRVHWVCKLASHEGRDRCENISKRNSAGLTNY